MRYTDGDIVEFRFAVLGYRDERYRFACYTAYDPHNGDCVIAMLDAAGEYMGLDEPAFSDLLRLRTSRHRVVLTEAVPAEGEMP